MAIAFDVATNGSNTTGTSLSWNHTCTGANLCLIVATVGDLSSDLITGVTYNGVALTKLNVEQIPSDRFFSLWGLIGAAVGTHAVVVTAASSTFIEAGSSSYTGVGSIETSAVNSNVGTSVSGSVTTTAANCWTVAGIANDNGTAATPGSGTTDRVNAGFGGTSIMDSNGALSPGSHALSASDGAADWSIIIASLAPVAASPPGAAKDLHSGPGVQPTARLQFQPAIHAVTTNVSVSLTGQAATFTPGTVTPSATLALSGAAATFAAGAIIPGTAVALTGQSATFNTGTLTISGQGGLGAIWPPGPGPAGPFNLQQFTAAPRSRTISTNVTVALTGAAASFAAGSVTATPSIPLIGSSGIFAPGTVASVFAIPLTGLSATFIAGALTPVSGVVVALTGAAATFTAGQLALSRTVGLTGVQLTFTAGTVRVGSGNMPNLIGLNYYEAQDALQAIGIYIPIPPYAFQPAQISVRWQKSTQYISGIVIDQAPLAGSNVEPGDPITLTVSSFPFGSLIE